MATAEVRRYWGQLVECGCLICRRPATIAHCHGASMVERTGAKAKGKKLPRLDWLVIPLCPDHAGEGPVGLDASPRAWEARFGRQADAIDRLCDQFGRNLWLLAGAIPAGEGCQGDFDRHSLTPCVARGLVGSGGDLLPAQLVDDPRSGDDGE